MSTPPDEPSGDDAPDEAHEPPTEIHEPATEIHEPATEAHEPPTQAYEPVTGSNPADPPTNPYLRVPPAGTAGPIGRPPAGAPSREGLGTAALVLGIVGVVLSLSVVVGLVLGVLAVIFGLVARGRVRRGEAFNGRSTTWGIALGAVAIVLAVATGVLVATNLPRLAAMAGAGGGQAGTVQQCVRSAHGDRAAIRRCRQEDGGARGGRHRGSPTPQGT